MGPGTGNLIHPTLVPEKMGFYGFLLCCSASFASVPPAVYMHRYVVTFKVEPHRLNDWRTIAVFSRQSHPQKTASALAGLSIQNQKGIYFIQLLVASSKRSTARVNTHDKTEFRQRRLPPTTHCQTQAERRSMSLRCCAVMSALWD